MTPYYGSEHDYPPPGTVTNDRPATVMDQTGVCCDCENQTMERWAEDPRYAQCAECGHVCAHRWKAT